MTYIAKDDRYTFRYSIKDSQMEEPICHTWTIGKGYTIDLNYDLNTISFESDAGSIENVPVLACNSELMTNVFGIDISGMILNANKINTDSVL